MGKSSSVVQFQAGVDLASLGAVLTSGKIAFPGTSRRPRNACSNRLSNRRAACHDQFADYNLSPHSLQRYAPSHPQSKVADLFTPPDAFQLSMKILFWTLRIAGVVLVRVILLLYLSKVLQTWPDKDLKEKECSTQRSG